MKINALNVFCWLLIIAGFAIRLTHYSVFNIPYLGFLLTGIGAAILYFTYEEKQEKIDK
jgi:hypothetical protein